jgi:hypothetical protein
VRLHILGGFTPLVNKRAAAFAYLRHAGKELEGVACTMGF